LWTATYPALLIWIGFTLSLSTATTVCGLIVERRRKGREVSVPGWPWVPVLFVVAVLAMTVLTVSRAPVPSLAGVGVLGLGWAFWYVSRSRPS
jgi:APA family basic amino acid/polyamine antiporter